MKIKFEQPQVEQAPRQYDFFVDYLKIIGMVLFGIALTTPVLAIIIMDVDLKVAGQGKNLMTQLIWDKPILPYIAGFLILVIQWFKFVEVNNYLRTTNMKHVLITFGFFFFLCLYPFFEMNIEFTAGNPHSRAVFSAAWGLLGVFQYWQLAYANSANLIKEELTPDRIQVMKNEILADPAVAAVCVGLSYTNLIIWIAGMVVLVPVMNYAIARISIEKGH